MRNFVAGHMTKMWFSKFWITSFWTQILPLNFKESKMLKRWFGKVDSISERGYQTLNKTKAKSSFGRHVGGQEYALQHGGQYKSYYFEEKSKCNKISPLNAFPLNFGCRIIFMCSVNFWHQQDSHSLFKGSIGHVTSCKWPIQRVLSPRFISTWTAVTNNAFGIKLN